MTNSRLYKISAWKDNSVKIVLTQGEGSSEANPTYNKVIKFQCYDSDGLLTIPANAEITLAIERPDKTTDLLSGSKISGTDSDIEFDVKNTLTTIAGIVKGEIRITTSSSMIKFFGINFNVYSGVSNAAAEISEEFDALTKALQKVSAVTAGGTVATLDSVIEHSGTNPVASGIIYDYIETVKQNLEKYVTNVDVDNAVRQDTLYRVYTSADGLLASGYHTVIAVPATNQIAQYLFAQNGAVLYRKCAATNGSQSGTWETWAKFAKYSDIPTNVSQLANDAGYLVSTDIAGKADSADVYTKSQTYSKTEADNKYQTLANKRNTIDSSRQTTTADNETYPSISAIKSFSYGNFYTQSETDDFLDEVKQYVINYTLTANGWNNGEQEITINAGDYDVSAYTKVDIEPGANALESLVNDGVFALYIENDNGDLTAKVIGNNVPRRDIIVQLVLSEVTAIESESE